MIKTAFNPGFGLAKLLTIKLPVHDDRTAFGLLLFLWLSRPLVMGRNSCCVKN